MSPEQFDAILARVSVGESVAKSTVAEGTSEGAFYRAVADPAAAERYARAKMAGCAKHAEAILDIADESPKVVPVQDSDGNVVELKADSAFEAWRKTRIDARKWTLAKLLPKVYGDKLELDATVRSGDAIIERLARARDESPPG